MSRTVTIQPGAAPSGGPNHATEQLTHAAEHAGVRVTELRHPRDHQRAAALLQEIWGHADGPPVTAETMRALDYTGNYVGAAFDGADMVAVAVGFRTDSGSLHSHIAGVAPSHQGRSVGYAIKLHQRVWSLDHGLDAITWTFDPLVRRNAHFNLVKLGARVADYLANFYGVMTDAINSGAESDRMVAHWQLSDRVPNEAARVPKCACAMVAVGPGGEPIVAAHDDIPPRTDRTIGLPRDIELLRHRAPETALQWRRTVRDAVIRCLTDGYRIAGFTADGSYLAQWEQI